MIIESDNLISEDDLSFIDKLSYKVARVERDDRRYSSHRLSNEEKSVFLKKLLIWVENKLDIKFRRYDLSLFDTFFINYNVGDFFLKHRDDTLMWAKGSKRKYVSGFHINEDYEGGDFVVYDYDDNFEIMEKRKGYPYIFESKMYHEVKPVLSGVRKSIVIHIDTESILTSEKQII